MLHVYAENSSYFVTSMDIAPEISEKLSLVVSALSEAFPQAETKKLGGNNDQDRPSRVKCSGVRLRSAEELVPVAEILVVCTWTDEVREGVTPALDRVYALPCADEDIADCYVGVTGD